MPPNSIQEYMDNARRKVEQMPTEEFRAEAKRVLASMPGGSKWRFDMVRREYERRTQNGLIPRDFPNDKPAAPPERNSRWTKLLEDSLAHLAAEVD